MWILAADFGPPAPSFPPLPVPSSFFPRSYLAGNPRKPGGLAYSKRRQLTLLSNGLNSSASASSGRWVETYQPGSTLAIPQGASMLLAGRRPGPSASYYPGPPAVSRARGGAVSLALPGSRTSPGPARKEDIDVIWWRSPLGGEQ